jgi:hypothetical protein
VEAVRGSGEAGRGALPRDDAAHRGMDLVARPRGGGWQLGVEDLGIWINCAGTEDSAGGNRGQRPCGLESKGGRWERDG